MTHRVFGFVAAEADVCVLLRRGPRKQALMVRWDLATDEFEIGQCLKARVYEKDCDLSPNGLLFSYTALRYNPPPRPSHLSLQRWDCESYTAISRPPFFTALALWEEMGRWVGNTWWESDSDLRFPTGGTPPDIGVLPEGLRVSTEAHLSWDDGRRRSRRRSARRQVRAERAHLTLTQDATGYKIDGRPLIAEWVDIDHRGRLLFAREGRIFVFDRRGERELINLNSYGFQAIPPPEWAKEWP